MNEEIFEVLLMWAAIAAPTSIWDKFKMLLLIQILFFWKSVCDNEVNCKCTTKGRAVMDRRVAKSQDANAIVMYKGAACGYGTMVDFIYENFNGVTVTVSLSNNESITGEVVDSGGKNVLALRTDSLVKYINGDAIVSFC